MTQSADTVDMTGDYNAAFIWNRWLGRVESSDKVCKHCDRPIHHESGWWVHSDNHCPACDESRFVPGAEDVGTYATPAQSDGGGADD